MNDISTLVETTYEDDNLRIERTMDLIHRTEKIIRKDDKTEEEVFYENEKLIEKILKNGCEKTVIQYDIENEVGRKSVVRRKKTYICNKLIRTQFFLDGTVEYVLSNDMFGNLMKSEKYDKYFRLVEKCELNDDGYMIMNCYREDGSCYKRFISSIKDLMVVKNGIMIYYDIKGTKISERPMKNGVIKGIGKYYYGNITFNVRISNDDVVTINEFTGNDVKSNRTLRSLTFGSRDEEFFRDDVVVGITKIVKCYKNNVCIRSIEFAADNSIIRDGQYNDREYCNGKYIVSYKAFTYRTKMKNNLQIGKAILYDEESKKKKIIPYNNGLINGDVLVFEGERLLYRATYSNNVKNGLVTRFSNDGYMILNELWKNGIFVKKLFPIPFYIIMTEGYDHYSAGFPIEKMDKKDVCCICLDSGKERLIKIGCGCNMLYHINCVIEVMKSKNDFTHCSVCRRSINFEKCRMIEFVESEESIRFEDVLIEHVERGESSQHFEDRLIEHDECGESSQHFEDRLIEVLVSDEECLICRGFRRYIVKLNCGHVYCKYCLICWIEMVKRRKCPMCLREIE
jgi:antitoxin component YwqK of YwqJK toxin-antitoxin module